MAWLADGVSAGVARSWKISALLACVCALSGCKNEASPVPSGSSSATTSSSSAAAVAPLPSATELNPVIRALGVEGSVPEKVVIEFSRNVIPDGGEPRPGTVFRIVPETPGQLSYRGSSTLIFSPTGGFALGTKYTVTLESLELNQGVVQAPKKEAWSQSFTTPHLSFLRLSAKEMDLRTGKVGVNLLFSGPVDLNAVRRLASFQVDGQPLTDVKFNSGNERSTLVAKLSSARLKPGTSVRFILKAGLPAPSGPPAPAGEDSLDLIAGKRMDITGGRVHQGPSGHYVDISCRDVESSSPVTPEDDEEDYGWSNTKGCSLNESVAADVIHFEPTVSFSVSPSRTGFRIFGNFKRGTYALRIDEGAMSEGGGVLLSNYENAFSVSARNPQVSFASSGRYLPRSAWRNLPLTHLNVDSVELTVRHVPQENLVFWMGNDGQERADERTSNVIVKRKLALQGKPDESSTTYVDVGSLVPASTRGLIQLTAEGGGTQASSRIVLTDLSLVAKRGASPQGVKGAEEIRVWALGMETTEPLSGVDVSLVRRSGQLVARCTTEGVAGCTLAVTPSALDDSSPFALIARKGEDLTYLKYSDLKTDIAASDIQGEPYQAETPYRAALYSDRGVYRPGDTAHVVALIRGKDNRAPAAGLPVDLQVVDARGRVFKKVTLKTNEAGVLSIDLPFEAFQDTGRYNVALSIANRSVGQLSLNVEEFVPERMKVTASTSAAGYGSSDEVPVNVEAHYLFGGSAEGSKVELACRLEPTLFQPKENAHFTYGVWRQGDGEAKPLTLGQASGTLDEKGNALIRCPAQQVAGGFKGAGALVALASVFEAGSGRATVSEVRVPVHPEPFYLGLQSGTQKASAGKAFTVSGVVVDWQGALVTDPAKLKTVEVEYLRLEEEYGYSYDESEGEERYQRFLRPVREGRGTAQVQGGKFTLQMTPTVNAAGYLVRVKAGAAQTDLQVDGQGQYGWYDGANASVDQTPRPLKPTSLALQLPRTAKVGEDIQVTFKAPYKGRVLLTAETDRVLAAEWKEVVPGEVKWSFKAASFAPNVYLSAFLVKDPHLESAQAFLPDRAFGVASVPLEPTEFLQTVKLEAPKEVRSNASFQVTLDLGPVTQPTFATVAVVDEGILSLTRFASPDPLKALFNRRALGVETYETVGWTLLVPPAGASRSTGGDGDGGAAGRVQPVKPLALWSGVLRVPADGKLQVPFTLPQYRGSVRVMAVTSGTSRVGKADASVWVRDPLVLQTTLPRFLSQGDEVQIPVFVTNLSGQAQDVQVSLAVEDLPVPGMTSLASAASPVQFLGKPEGSRRIENGKSATLVFQARAVQAVGAARLKVVAKAGSLVSSDQLDVPLLPAGARERRVQRLELAEGKLDLAPLLQGWVPTSEKSTFWVTSNPYGESFQHLSYLVHYPYGCIEQTTSSTRPLLFVSSLLDRVDPSALGGQRVEDMVMAGVRRVLSMQTPSGGFAYWPGQSDPVAWGTAYATHMLIDAQKLKFDVPQDRLDDAITWMGEEAGRLEGQLQGNGHRYQEDAEPYLHYVLALSGKGRKARVQKLIDAVEKRTPRTGQLAEQAYLLKAALYLSGDRRYEQDLRSPDSTPVAEDRRNDWSFYSDRRRRGMMLSTFQDLFGSDAAGEPLAQRVAQALLGPSPGYTTQELVWGVTGLGKRVGTVASTFTPPTLSAEGKVMTPVAAKNQRSSDRSWALARASERKALSLDVPSKGQGSLFLIANSEGVRTDASPRIGGEGLSLSRTYRTLGGAVLDVTHRPVGLADLVYVEVEIHNQSRERVQNIALVDRLPAGWEMENARLGRGGSVDWVAADEQWAPDYVNLRDDRIEIFGSLEAGEKKKVTYAVRVVTSGTFTLPPVEAEAMYNPKIWARGAGGKVEVTGPWKDFLL